MSVYKGGGDIHLGAQMPVYECVHLNNQKCNQHNTLHTPTTTDKGSDGKQRARGKRDHIYYCSRVPLLDENRRVRERHQGGTNQKHLLGWGGSLPGTNGLCIGGAADGKTGRTKTLVNSPKAGYQRVSPMHLEGAGGERGDR